MFEKWCYNLLLILFVQLASCVELDLVDCGVDHELEVATGDVEITKYPWIGILYYTYYGDIGETRSVTTVILIQKEFVIANAADIGPMPKTDFRRKSRVLLGERWPAVGRRVRNYVLHPEYGETYNTLALVQLKDPVTNLKIKPVCPAPERLRNPVFYVMKFKEDYNIMQKQVIPVAHVPGSLCKEFYVRANLYTRKMRPPHVACAVSLDVNTVCVWAAGAALVSRDVWGRWMLLGVGVRGPGCGAPSRFLDMSSYSPWVTNSLNRFQRITISKISKQKYVLRSSGISEDGQSAYQRYGNCDPEEKRNCIYRELINLRTDNQQWQFFTYNMTIVQNVDYTCLTLEMVNASAVSEMRIQHYCPRDNFGPPCYYYKGSVFSISVYIIYADTCLFEMYAWGYLKNLKMLDIQEWKWEEGTYYEDFSDSRTEYRGQKYMTEFGYEPLDQKMWVPEYDLWTTTDDGSASTTTAPPIFDQSYVYPTPPPTTTSTTPPSTLPRTKRTFKRKTTTSTTTVPSTTT